MIKKEIFLLLIACSFSFASDLKSWIGRLPVASGKSFFDLPEVRKGLSGILSEEDSKNLEKISWKSPLSYMDHVLATCSTPSDPTEKVACVALRLPEGTATLGYMEDRYIGSIDWRAKEIGFLINKGPSLLGEAKHYVAGCRPQECTRVPGPRYTSFPEPKQVGFLRNWVEKHPAEVDKKTKKDFFDQKQIKPLLGRLFNKKELERLSTDLISVTSGFGLYDGILIICGMAPSKKEGACLLYDPSAPKIYVVFRSPDGSKIEWRGTESPSTSPDIPFTALIATIPKRVCCR